MEEIQKFKEAIVAFRPTWKTVEVKAIADLDAGVLLSMVACLTPDTPKPLEVIDSLQGIAFVREAIPVSDLDKLLEGWEHGAIALASNQLSTSNFESSHFTGLQSGYDDFVSGWPDFKNYRHLMLHSYGRQSLDVLVGPKSVSAIAQILGFNSFSELSSQRVQFRVGSSDSTRLEIFAPVLADIEAKPEAGRVRLSIRVHEALEVSDLSLSFRVQDQKGSRLDGGSIQIDEFQKSSSGYFTVLELSKQIPDGSASGEVSLYHKVYKSQSEPVTIARFTVIPGAGATNPRWNLLLSAVANTREWTRGTTEPEEVIERWLGMGQIQPNGADFERGVAALLFAAGFSVLSIGKAEGVDQLVFFSESSKAAMIVSCTTSPNLRDKIPGLALQFNRARDRLPALLTYAAICAPVDTADLTPEHVVDCRDKHIQLILRPELRNLFNQVRGVNWGKTREDFLLRLG